MLLNLTISYHLFSFEFNVVAFFVFLRLLLRVLLVFEMRMTFYNAKSASLTVQESDDFSEAQCLFTSIP